MRRTKGFTLVEIMIVVAIIGILIAIAVPSFLRAREVSRRNACQENMNKIDGAKQQWALETNAAPTAVPTADDLYGDDLYVRRTPVCPGGGVYTIGNLATDPSCSYNASSPEFAHTFLGGAGAAADGGAADGGDGGDGGAPAN